MNEERRILRVSRTGVIRVHGYRGAQLSLYPIHETSERVRFSLSQRDQTTTSILLTAKQAIAFAEQLQAAAESLQDKEATSCA